MTRHRTLLTGVLTGSLILGLGLAAPALAQSVDDRLSNQAERIPEGIRNESLTPGEAARSQRQQARLSREERRFKSDGSLSPGEQRRIWRDENRASCDIYRLKHNQKRDVVAI